MQGKKGSYKSLHDRFWSKVQLTDSCWIWLGARHPEDGHGWIALANEHGKRKASWAHRISWLLHYGEIPEKAQVLHKCDVPWCVNPAHLYLGDHRANSRDAVERGQIKTGEQHHNAKLSNADVLEIRRIGKAQPAAVVAARFGVVQQTIYEIRSGQTRRFQ